MAAQRLSTDMPSPLGGKTILIVGLNYWPEPTGNAPYTTGLAEHLARRGAAVHVLTGMPYYPSWSVDAPYAGKIRLNETRNGVSLHRYRNYVPREQSAAKRALFEASFLANAIRSRSIPKPDVILGVLPSLSDGVLTVNAARRFGVPFGLYIQDLVGQSAAQSGISGGGRVVGFTQSVEGWAARKASSIAIVAEGFRPRLVEMGVDPSRIVRVRNWTHVKPATRTREAALRQIGVPAERTICLHAGNMGLKQGLENLIDCARIAERAAPNLLFVLLGDGNQRATLVQRAAGLSNVQFVPPQSDEDFPDMLAAADVLLVNQRPSVTDMSLPGKLTSYFASGRPVVAAVAPGSETARELNDAGAGLVVDAGDPTALLDAITRVTGDPDVAHQLGERGRVFQQANLTEETALARLEDFLIGVLNKRTEPEGEPDIVGQRALLGFDIREGQGASNG